MTSITVAVRVRPFNAREIKYGSRCIIAMPQSGACLVEEVRQGRVLDGVPARRFVYDHAFWTHDTRASDDESGESTANVSFASQQFVYEQLGASILKNALQGFNGCLFAYGQTGSGKTYTMMGVPSDPGVIPRLCRDLFAEVQTCAANGTALITVECSYLEIYNENVRDLLSPVNYKGAPLKVRQHPSLGVYVEGLTKMSVQSEAEILKLLDDGGKLRAVASTNMNATSSRSHAILTLVVKSKRADCEVQSMLNLVDLAGSERASATGAEGDTLMEGANINKSLTVLGRCLSGLADASEGGTKSHVPFRESQLTWILNESLGGNSKTAMLANISPASINYEETLSTLRFALTVKKIKNNAVVNEDPQQKLIRELRAQIQEIKQQIDQLLQERSLLPAGARVPASAEPDASDDALLSRLAENEQLMAEAQETAEERDNRMKLLKITHERAMREVLLAQQSTSFLKALSMTTPRLLTLNEDLHALSTIALIYFLREGSTIAGFCSGEAGSGQSLTAPSIRLPATWGREVFLPVHVVFVVSALSETVSMEVPALHSSDVLTSSINNGSASGLESSANPTGGSDEVLVGTPSSVPPRPSTRRIAQVCLNGSPVAPGQRVQVEHLSRILVGNIAFKMSLPATWKLNRCEFSTGPIQSRWHWELLEQHGRHKIEGEYLREVSSIVEPLLSDQQGGKDAHPAAQWASETHKVIDGLLSAVNCLLGHVETQLVEEFPAADVQPSASASATSISGGSDVSLVSEYDEALKERDRHRQAAVDAAKAQRETALQLLRRQSEDNSSQIAALRMQLEAQEAAGRAAEEKRRADERRRNSPPPLAQTGTRQSDQQPSTPQPAPQASHVDPAAPPTGGSAPSTPAAGDSALRGSKHRSTARRSIVADAEMLALARELQAYEDECRTARQWKPEGPTKAEDQAEYLASQQEMTLANLMRLGRPTHTTTCHKYRIKHGLFRRTGFHKVFLIVRARFMYYFDSSELKSKSLGAAYLFGADCTLVSEPVDGKKFLLRVVPSVPRKPSKSEMGPTEENNVLFGFDSEAEMHELHQVLQQLVAPSCPPRVAEYLKKKDLTDAE
jgi:hypothetical protein